MSESLGLTRQGVLRVVQSFAQSLRGDGGHTVGDASLFLTIRDLREFSGPQIESLATASLAFFGLDGQAVLPRDLCARNSLEDWAERIYAAWDRESVYFGSSGSTGIPVRHRYLLSSMYEEIAAAAPFFSACRRTVSVMPMHHIFGMMYGALLARYLDVPAAYAPPLPLASLFGMLRPGDALIGFPFFWQSLLTVVREQSAPPYLALPEGLCGVTATGPCPPEVIRGLLELEKTGKSPSLAAMREIYGATEVNGIGIRLDGGEWYELFSLWETVREGDAVVALRLRATGATGATGGGAGDPKPLPDVLAWKDDRRFKPERRADKAVQVAGINVYPERVAAVIREHPQVRDCAVRLMRPEEGARLKAFIVPSIPPTEARRLFGKPFREWLAVRLETAARPKRITLGPDLPRNAMGKLRDWD